MWVNQKLSPRREKSRAWILAVIAGVLGTTALGIRAKLHAEAHGGDWTTALASGAGGAAVAIIVLAVIAPIAWRTYARRRAGHLEAVQAARPGATIIPAFTARDSLNGLRQTDTSTVPVPKYSAVVAIAVLNDCVEVWVRGSGAPMGTIQRHGMVVRIGTVPRPRGSQQGIHLDDGTSSVTFVPHHPHTNRATQFERALLALGEEPAQHVEHDSGPGAG